MLNNITFGQYFPADSFVHKMDARFKLLMTFALIVFAFVAFNFASLGLVAVFTVFVLLLTKIPLKMYFRTLKTIFIFILISAVLNIFYVTDGTLLFSYGIIRIYTGGILRAVFVAVRIVLLILISAVLTYTTTPTSLTDAIESLLKPLSKIGIDTHTFAMMMTIALRFIPTLIEETDKIMSAQKARGADMENGGLIKRIKSVIPILIPLLVSSIRRAKELADAMECRCYHGGKGRTRLKVLKAGRRDVVATISVCVLLTGIILLNIFI